MKNIVNERLAEFIRHLDVSKVDFARLIGETKFSVNNWLSDTKIPVSSLSNILLVYPQLNARWLMTGDGEMISNQASDKKTVDEIQKFAEDNSRYGRCSLCAEKDKRILELEMHRDDLRQQLGLQKVLKNGS
jgi:hypothetical protein